MTLHVITTREIRANLLGAFRIFFMLDRTRLDRMRKSMTAATDFWKSFWVALILLPLHVWLFSIVDASILSSEAGFGRRMIVSLSAYSIGWVYWPLVMAAICRRLGKDDAYIPYIVCYNWLAAPPLLCATVLVGILGIGFWDFVLFAWTLIVQFMLARRVLGIPFLLTAGLVGGDFALGQILYVARTILLHGG